MFWTANELIQREYDCFFFLLPHLWFGNYRSLVQKCQRSSTRVACLSLKPNTNVNLSVLQRIGKSIVIILRCGPLMPLYLPVELLFGCCQLAIAIGFVSAFKSLPSVRIQ